jgi:hypothetical protein
MVPISTASLPTAPNAAKSMLARLLATENISVQHQNIPTAFFDLKTRSLHLPLWSNTSGSLYDMLVGHEVAHALFTPVDGWRSAIDSVSAATGCTKDTAKQYLNIVEDARIERMIQSKFRGLKADFISAYKTLMEREFFGDLSKIGDAIFADRFNIYFKCGVHAGTAVRFSAEEAAFVTRGETVATWDEVVALATDMIVWAQEQKAQEQEQGNQPQPVEADGEDADGESAPVSGSGDDSEPQDGESESNTGETEDGDPTDQEGSEGDGSSAADETDSEDAQSGRGNGKGEQKGQPTNTEPQTSGDDDGIAPSTNRNLEEQLKTLADADAAAPARVVRVSVPSTDSSEVVIPFTRIIADLSATGFASFMKTPVKIADYTAATNMMATAFNRKKAADVFRRSTVAKSGSLDTLRMNQYKWTDDIFRKTTRLAEGKNHGIVILLDWSGSMNHIMQSTIGQLLILTDFCRKVGVPFEVYAFSNTPYTEGTAPKYGTDEYYAEMERRQAEAEAKRGELALCNMNLLNFLSSRMNAAQYEAMKTALWNWRSMSQYDSRFAMNSTPTNAALLYASDIVAKFQAATRVQIMHTVVLTDGEPTDGFEFSLSRWMRKQGEDEQAARLSWRDEYRNAVVMSDPATGASYDIQRVPRKDGGSYIYGNVVFSVGDAYYGRDEYTNRIALDILRRRTGTKIHWIGLTTAKRVDPGSYRMVSKAHNYKRDGFIRGAVAGWDSAVVVDATRFLRNSDGSVANTAAKALNDAEHRMVEAKSKRELQNAFIDSQIAAGSLRTVASIVGEYLAV